MANTVQLYPSLNPSVASPATPALAESLTTHPISLLASGNYHGRTLAALHAFHKQLPLHQHAAWWDGTTNLRFDAMLESCGIGKILLGQQSSDVELYSALLNQLETNSSLLVWDQLQHLEDPRYIGFIRFAKKRMTKGRLLVTLDSLPPILEETSAGLNIISSQGQTPAPAFAEAWKALDAHTQEHLRQAACCPNPIKAPGGGTPAPMEPFGEGRYFLSPAWRQYIHQEHSPATPHHEAAVTSLAEADDAASLETRFWLWVEAGNWEGIAQDLEKSHKDYLKKGYIGLLVAILETLKTQGHESPLHLYIRGQLADRALEYKDAIQHYKGALAQTEAPGLKAMIMNALGEATYYIGESQEAHQIFNDTVTLCLTEGLQAESVRPMNNVGLTLTEAGKTKEATQSHQAALATATAMELTEDMSVAHTNLAMVSLNTGQWPDALKRLREALALRQKAGDPIRISKTMVNLGNLHENLGKFTEAAEWYQEAINLLGSVGNTDRAIAAMLSMGNLMQKQQQLEPARLLYDKAMALATEIERTDKQVDTNARLANLLHQEGLRTKALTHYQRALAGQRSIKEDSLLVSLLNSQGGVQQELKQWAGAHESYQEALTIAGKIKQLPIQAQTHYQLGSLLASKDHPEYDNALYHLLMAFAMMAMNGAQPQGPGQWLVEIRDKRLPIDQFRLLLDNAYSKIPAQYQPFVPMSNLQKAPAKSANTPGRNERVKVQFSDGRIVEGKYKKFEADIAQGNAVLVTE